MRQWPGRLEPLHAAVDAGRLENHNENRERPRPIDFLKIDHLLIVDLADDDPRQFHRDGHGGVSLSENMNSRPTPLYSRNIERRVVSVLLSLRSAELTAEAARGLIASRGARCLIYPSFFIAA